MIKRKKFKNYYKNKRRNKKDKEKKGKEKQIKGINKKLDIEVYLVNLDFLNISRTKTTLLKKL